MENKYFNIKPLIPKNKRGMGIGDIYPVILTIALVAILMAIVMLVLGEFGDAWEDNEDGGVTNETLSSAHQGTANLTVAHATYCRFNDMVVSDVTNSSNGYPILVGNYTAYSDGHIINLTSTHPHIWNVTYGYQWGGKPCDATENITDDFTDFIPWIGVILLVIAAAIVLGILIKSFSGSGRV